MKRVLIPVPSIHFDPSEVTIPWKIFTSNNVSVVFATPDGKIAACDQIMLTGKGLGLLSGILACSQEVRQNYEEMIKTPEFINPITWADCKAEDFDCLLLPGGHDKGCREYLESAVLQALVVQFFDSDKLVGAVCHGVLLAARSKRADGKSVLFGRKTTGLLAQQELAAYRLTALWMGDYYLTYPVTVEDEVRPLLERPDDFVRGKNPGITRDAMAYYRSKGLNNHVVRDGNYVSARWPGDCHLLGFTLLEVLTGQTQE
jgi:protease I